MPEFRHQTHWSCTLLEAIDSTKPIAPAKPAWAQYRCQRVAGTELLK